jgi:hypothetical protein
MNEYNENTYTFWIYIFDNTAKPWNWEHCGGDCGEGRASILEKGRLLEGAVKGWAPGIFLQEEPLALIYQFEDKAGGALQGAIGAKGIVGPGGNGTVFDLRASLLEKGRDLNLVGAFKGHAPAMFIREEPLALIYFYEGGEGNQGVLGPDSVGPGGKGTGFEPKTWYHIAGVKQGSDLTIYIDGKEIGIYAVPIAFVQGEGHLRVGATDIRASSFAMDEFQLFDRPLTKEEVALDVKGILHSVEPQDKLATSWGRIKTGR